MTIISHHQFYNFWKLFPLWAVAPPWYNKTMSLSLFIYYQNIYQCSEKSHREHCKGFPLLVCSCILGQHNHPFSFYKLPCWYPPFTQKIINDSNIDIFKIESYYTLRSIASPWYDTKNPSFISSLHLNDRQCIKYSRFKHVSYSRLRSTDPPWDDINMSLSLTYLHSNHHQYRKHIN